MEIDIVILFLIFLNNYYKIDLLSFEVAVHVNGLKK